MGVRVPTFAPTICSSSAEAATSTVTTFVTTSPTFPSGTEGSLGAESEQTRAQLHHAEDERLRPHATPSLETKARCSQKTGRGNLEEASCGSEGRARRVRERRATTLLSAAKRAGAVSALGGF